MEYLPALLMLVLFALDIADRLRDRHRGAVVLRLCRRRVPLHVFVQKFVQATDSFPLLACPSSSAPARS